MISKAKRATALEKAIKKWQGIVDGTVADEGVINCALCQMFIRKECYGCPVSHATGRPYCAGSPYDQWEKATPGQYFATTPKLKRLARKMLRFLEGLRT